jgi:hypothetical protein
MSSLKTHTGNLMSVDERITMTIASNRSTVLQKAFKLDADGKISFGVSARSRSRQELADLFIGPVEFVDYVMEGFVHYCLQLREQPTGIIFELTKLGTNRDKHLNWLLHWHLSSLGFSTTDS